MRRSRHAVVMRTAPVFTLSIVLSGCLPLQEATSGEVGCAPSEIQIEDESGEGSVQTWTAICRGRRFYCSSTSGGYSGYGNYGGYAAARVSCQEEIDSDEAVASGQPPPAQPNYVRAPLPQKAVGFHFNASVEEARVACEEGGHHWTTSDRGYKCSGTPTDVGLKTESKLGFCAGKLCDLTVIASFNPGSVGETQFRRLWSSLRDQYGKPGVERKHGGEECSSRFVSCVAAGMASWQAEWKWGDGRRIIAKTLTNDGRAQLGIRYHFGEADRTRPPRVPGEVDGAAF